MQGSSSKVCGEDWNQPVIADRIAGSQGPSGLLLLRRPSTCFSMSHDSLFWSSADGTITHGKKIVCDNDPVKCRVLKELSLDELEE